MFASIYYFCNEFLSVVVEFCYNMLDLLSTEVTLGTFGSFQLIDGVFAIFISTLVARLIISMSTG